MPYIRVWLRPLLLVTLAALAALFVSIAHAASAPSLLGVDVMTANVMQEKQSSFSGLGLRVRLHDERLIDAVTFMPTVEYWRSSSTVTGFGIHSVRSDATLGCDIRYALRATGWKPYVGGGYALHFLESEVNAPALGLNNASHALTKGGVTALAGATFPLTGRLENVVELKYHHVTDYRQLKINMGLAYSW